MISKKISPKESIHGFGLFAKEKIFKGEEVIRFEGYVITKDKANELYDSGFDYMLQINQDQFLLLENNEKYSNHSCEPNIYFQEEGKAVALQDIEVGDEIVFDYSSNEDSPFLINCLCGSKACRGQIMPYRDLSESQKESIKGILTPYLKKTYQSKN